MRTPPGPPFVQHALFGGRGAVRIWDLLGGEAPPFSAALWCALDPHGVVGAHRQQRDPELIIGLAGEGRALVDGVAHPLTAGSAVSLPFGSLLQIENLTDAPLQYLIVKARG